jgi:putative inorganic carbon (HCO3(-)) transporter
VKGAWLLAIPASFLLLGALRGRRFFMGALLVLAMLGASLLPVLGTTRIRSLFDLSAGTSFIRVQLWQSAIAMIRDHPLFGVGLDNFLYQYRTRYILPTAFAEAGLSHPHNVLLDFWTRLGLVGVALLALLLVVFWRKAYAYYRSSGDENARALALGLMASMLAALVHGLIDNSFFLVDLSFVLMLTLAIVQQQASLHHNGDPGPSASSRSGAE